MYHIAHCFWRGDQNKDGPAGIARPSPRKRICLNEPAGSLRTGVSWPVRSSAAASAELSPSIERVPGPHRVCARNESSFLPAGARGDLPPRSAGCPPAESLHESPPALRRELFL